MGHNALDLLVLPLCKGIAVPYLSMMVIVFLARWIGNLAAGPAGARDDARADSTARVELARPTRRRTYPTTARRPRPTRLGLVARPS